jgi:uncharacterized membrane protein
VPCTGHPGRQAGCRYGLVSTAGLARQVAWSGGLLWLAWGVLFLQQAADAWVYEMPWLFWLVKLLPLLIFLPGMRADNLRSYIWLCFVCLLYFITLVERLFAQPGEALPIIGTTAVVTLFIAAMLYVRWRARDLRADTNTETLSETDS